MEARAWGTVLVLIALELGTNMLAIVMYGRPAMFALIAERRKQCSACSYEFAFK